MFSDPDWYQIIQYCSPSVLLCLSFTCTSLHTYILDQGFTKSYTWDLDYTIGSPDLTAYLILSSGKRSCIWQSMSVSAKKHTVCHLLHLGNIKLANQLLRMEMFADLFMVNPKRRLYKRHFSTIMHIHKSFIK